MSPNETESLEEKAQRILTEELPEAVASAPVANGVDPEPKRWQMGKALVDIELPDMTFFSKTDPDTGIEHRAHVFIDGIDVGPVLQGIQINADIHSVNTVVLHMIGLPTRIRALGVVEIESKGLDGIADEFMARAERDAIRQAEKQAQWDLEAARAEAAASELKDE